MARSAVDVGNDVGSAMAAAGAALRAVTKEVMVEAGKIAREELILASKPPTGGDGKFSRGGKLGVVVRQSPGLVTVAPRGLWGVAEGGARAHAGFAWGHPFSHPGTSQGTLAWSRGREATFDRLGIEVVDRVGDAVEAAFVGAD